jgi:hypothetical protein
MVCCFLACLFTCTAAESTVWHRARPAATSTTPPTSVTAHARPTPTGGASTAERTRSLSLCTVVSEPCLEQNALPVRLRGGPMACMHIWFSGKDRPACGQVGNVCTWSSHESPPYLGTREPKLVLFPAARRCDCAAPRSCALPMARARVSPARWSTRASSSTNWWLNDCRVQRAEPRQIHLSPTSKALSIRDTAGVLLPAASSPRISHSPAAPSSTQRARARAPSASSLDFDAS